MKLPKQDISHPAASYFSLWSRRARVVLWIKVASLIAQCRHEFVSYPTSTSLITLGTSVSKLFFLTNTWLMLNAYTTSRRIFSSFPLYRSLSLSFALVATIPRDIPSNRKVPPGRSFSWRNRCNRYEKPNSQMAKIKLSDSWQSQETTLLHGDKFEAWILACGHATWTLI